MNPTHPPHQAQTHSSSPVSPHAPPPLPPIHTHPASHRSSNAYQLPPPVPSYVYTPSNSQNTGGSSSVSTAYYSGSYHPSHPPQAQSHPNAPPPSATVSGGGLSSNPPHPPPPTQVQHMNAGAATAVHDVGAASNPSLGGSGGMASILQPSATYHTQYSASAPASTSSHPPNPPIDATQSSSLPPPQSQSQTQQTPSPTLLSARRHTTTSIGSHITFASGPFAGRTVRAELVEVQKADLGRKCADPPTASSNSSYSAPGAGQSPTSSNERDRDAPEGQSVSRDRDRRDKDKEEPKSVRKDRRPLDPPPVVSLRYFEAIHYGDPVRQYEREIPAEEVEIGGLICQVDLFRVTIPPSEAEVRVLEMQMRERVEGMGRVPLPGVHEVQMSWGQGGTGATGVLGPGVAQGPGQLGMGVATQSAQGASYQQQWSATPYEQPQSQPLQQQGPNYPYPPPPSQHSHHASHPSHPHSHPYPHPHLPPIDTHTHPHFHQQPPSPTLAPGSASSGGEDVRKRRRTGTNSGLLPSPGAGIAQSLANVHTAGIVGGLLRPVESVSRERADSSANEKGRERVGDRVGERERRERNRGRGREEEREDAQSSPISPYAQTQTYAHSHSHSYGASSMSSSYPPPSSGSASSYPPPSASTSASSSAYPPSTSTSLTPYSPPISMGVGGGAVNFGLSGPSSGPGAPINPDELPLPTEADKLTRCLFGEYFSHAASILDLKGKAVIYFVFSDLSVKLEGLFRPRYRFFDLFSRTANSDDVPVLAECFGGTFAVYSTKEFPGLKASTELTKHLNRWGIRVNIRETERKRRTGGGSAPSSGLGPAGRRGSEDDDGEGNSGNNNNRNSSPTKEIMDAPRRFLEGTAAQREREKERSVRERATGARQGHGDGTSAGSSEGRGKKGKRRRSVGGKT